MRLPFFLLAALFLCACTQLKKPGDVLDASVGAQAEAEPIAPADANCVHRVPPAPPDAAALAASRNQVQAAPADLVFAVSRTVYGTGFAPDGGLLPDAGTGRFKTIGFDLDNTCTGVGSCVEPSYATAEHHDGVDGIDNAYGLLLLTGPDNPDGIDASPDQTEVLIRVRNYSGAPDDDQIDVSFYLGLGVSQRPDGGTGLLWDGQDRWTILPETLVNPSAPTVDQPRFHAKQAYVSSGVLVAIFDEVLWPGTVKALPRLLITAHQLQIAGDLVRADAGGAWALKNVVVGTRIGRTDVLIVSAYEPNPLPGFDGGPMDFLCNDLQSYNTVKLVVACPYLDVTMDPAAPPSSVCDALSLGLLYDTGPALLGGIAKPAPPAPPCGTGVQPAMDSCDTLGDP